MNVTEKDLREFIRNNLIIKVNSKPRFGAGNELSISLLLKKEGANGSSSSDYEEFSEDSVNID